MQSRDEFTYRKYSDGNDLVLVCCVGTFRSCLFAFVCKLVHCMPVLAAYFFCYTKDLEPLLWLLNRLSVRDAN